MNHCIKCGNNIPEDVETCEEAGFGDGCGKTLRNMNKDNTKEGVEWEKTVREILFPAELVKDLED